MILQLKNGKCLYLTVEQYLALSDIDIEEITSLNIGSFLEDPFKHSSIITKQKITIIEEEIDTSIDYKEESEEIEVRCKRTYLTIDELNEIPDDNLED